MNRSASWQGLRASCAIGVLTALGLAQPALGQSDPQAQGDSSRGDIIVTARRTEERLQDVPISITVFSQEDLSRRNIVTGVDLAANTPSLRV